MATHWLAFPKTVFFVPNFGILTIRPDATFNCCLISCSNYSMIRVIYVIGPVVSGYGHRSAFPKTATEQSLVGEDKEHKYLPKINARYM